MATVVIALASALACIFCVLWLNERRSAASREQSALAGAEVRVAELKQQYEARLRDSLRLGEELRTQLQAMLPQVAESVLGAKTEQLEKDAAGDRQLLRTHFDGTLQEMIQRLSDYQSRINQFEAERAAAQGQMLQQVAALQKTGTDMAHETQSLRTALTSSGGIRGKWGESVLKNILESCSLNEFVDFEIQVHDAGTRPDVVLRLPGGRRLAIDAKANLKLFTEGLDAAGEEARRACYAEFARVLRRTAKELAGRDYPAQIDGGLPFVVMFVASEMAFRAALDADPELFLFAQTCRPEVILASPSTLFPLVKLIADGWQQQRASQKMREMLDEVGELGKRLRVYSEHVQKIGKGLDAAGKAFNDAVGSFNKRLGPRLERLQELGAGWEEIDEPRPVEHPVNLALPAAAGDE